MLTVLDKRADDLGFWPFVLRVVGLGSGRSDMPYIGEFIPSLLVHVGNGREVVFKDGLVEEDQELASGRFSEYVPS